MINTSHSSTPTNSGNSRQTKEVHIPHKEIDGKPESHKQDGINPKKELALTEYPTQLKEKKENDDKGRNSKVITMILTTME